MRHRRLLLAALSATGISVGILFGISSTEHMSRVELYEKSARQILLAYSDSQKRYKTEFGFYHRTGTSTGFYPRMEGYTLYLKAEDLPRDLRSKINPEHLPRISADSFRVLLIFDNPYSDPHSDSDSESVWFVDETSEPLSLYANLK